MIQATTREQQATTREQQATIGRARIPDTDSPVDLPNGVTLPPLREKWTLDGREHYREVGLHVGAEERMKLLWRENKEQFVRRGFFLQSHNEKWYLSQWVREITLRDAGKEPVTTHELTKGGQEALNAMLAPEELALRIDQAILQMDALPAWIEALLKDYQVEPARQLFRAITHGMQEWGYPGGWDCSEMGTGKTYTSYAVAVAMIELGLVDQVGVIAPISTHQGWREACAHFKTKARFITNYEALRTGRRDWLGIEKYDTGVRGLDGRPTFGRRFSWKVDPGKTILLYDEAHNLKNTLTRNQAIAIASIRQTIPSIFMSGTLAKDPTEMRATGRIIGLHRGGDSWIHFLACNGCSTKGKKPKFCGDKRGRKILTLLHHKIFPMRGARIKISDLGDRFPETQILSQAFQTTETVKINAEFRKCEAIIDQLGKQGADESRLLGLLRTAYMHAWQASEILKVETIVEMTRDEIAEGRHVAIFVTFVPTRLALMKAFKTQCGIHGGQNPGMRDHWLTEFQADREPVIVNQIDAGGVGVNLHDVRGEFPRTSIILPSNKVVSVKQALGRVHRSGGMSRSRQIILFAAGTLEERICRGLRVKMENIDSLNDGDLNPVHLF